MKIEGRGRIIFGERKPQIHWGASFMDFLIHVVGIKPFNTCPLWVLTEIQWCYGFLVWIYSARTCPVWGPRSASLTHFTEEIEINKEKYKQANTIHNKQETQQTLRTATKCKLKCQLILCTRTPNPASRGNLLRHSTSLHNKSIRVWRPTCSTSGAVPIA